MKKNIILKRILFVLFFTFFFSASYVSAFSDLSIPEENIFFFNENPIEGELVRIYATVENSGDKDSRGFVRFLVNGIRIGSDQPFSVLSGQNSTVFVDWWPLEGVYSISAEILNTDPKDEILENNIAKVLDFYVAKNGDTENFTNQNQEYLPIEENNPAEQTIVKDLPRTENDIFNEEEKKEFTIEEVKYTFPDEKEAEYKINVIIAKSRTSWNTWKFDALGGDSSFVYLWDFGDGKFSDSRNPEHVFSKTGEFLVSVTVADRSGGLGEATEIINIGFWHLGNPLVKVIMGFLIVFSLVLVFLIVFKVLPEVKN